jgi:ABC-2 type transport system permease protein
MMKLMYFEWLHFWRNSARPIAVLLFLIAACFGIFNGQEHYADRMDELESIQQRTAETHQLVHTWFDSGDSGPADRPWVDIKTPFWSMWYADHYLVDTPKPTMVFNIGQSEHFGYYKKVSMWTTAFDDDLTAELANPEFVLMGALDFTFVWIYLMPILLIVLTYQMKGLENDLGFIPLLKIQRPSLSLWIIQRLVIIGLGFLVLLTLLIVIPSLMLEGMVFGDTLVLWLIYVIYLFLWLILVFIVLNFGKGQADQALKLLGVWLMLTVVIPGAVNQYVLLRKPADLMMAMIEANREGQQEIYDRPQDDIIASTFQILPELKELDVSNNDSLLNQPMINSAYRLVLNDYMSDISNQIMEIQVERNEIIARSYWFNPVSGFHNWINNVTNTGHEANLVFRRQIQRAGESINCRLIIDEWNNKKIDRGDFDEYTELFEQI